MKNDVDKRINMQYSKSEGKNSLSKQQLGEEK